MVEAMDEQPSYEDLQALLQEAHADIYIHQVILGESSVPKHWHQQANALLEKYRPITDKIQNAIEEAVTYERSPRPDTSEGLGTPGRSNLPGAEG